ncbi:MAG: hypothetical protein CK424_00700 [Legionella sp.]|nr:MAG: hypothetical protein CK424_00700 [Legionella sp.]
MLKNILRTLIFSFSITCPMFVSALEISSLPDSFHIKTNTNCPGGCFSLTSQNQLIGELLLVPRKTGTYVYVNGQNQPQLFLRLVSASSYTGLLYFDMLDTHKETIARLMVRANPKSGQLMGFVVYTQDYKTLLVTGSTNLFGTKHTIYAKNSWHELATLSRPLFTWSRDADVTVLDQAGLEVLSNINPHLLPAILAFYCSHHSLSVDAPEPSNAPDSLQLLQNKLDAVAQERGFSKNNPAVSEEKLKATVEMMHQKYQQIYDDTLLSEEEKIKQFVNFGCELIQSHTFQPAEENAIIQFLSERLAQRL